ncbi:trypsin-like serine protease [Xanthomonas axonopodis pv. vasculorum]|uniref:Endoproteinase ArgC n=1 Tax=Xanthomonas axonopodis pv. vasculorum TaxID=325777 RepID=A0A098PWF3_9XANT|nr:trypsin-like serine protease [Xanthomonas axonopodis]KGE51345.1 endoproteinase ArgC [Xanthomonas axonopodis pv. vasculorum]PPV11053.1 serine protease [Xanthomonas axonopodis pv. vasculorum]QKD85802.1 trypsin-like serine protease [Xanthomonas axonopodis pv. vasculorum]
MNIKHALSVALIASAAGLSSTAIATTPPAVDEMDSAPLDTAPDVAALGGAELHSLAADNAHVPTLIALPVPDSASVSRMQRLREQQARQRKPLQIGFPRDIVKPDIDLRQLSWQTLRNGAQVSSFEVSSANAAALRVALQLSGSGAIPGDPGQATLRFASNDGRVFEQNGAYFAGSEPGWSAVVAGARMMVEIELPKGQSPQNFALKMPKVSHMDISPVANDAMMQPIRGESGSCEHDIACRTNPTPEFLAAAKSVARMLITNKDGSSFTCTGTLLNNRNTPKRFLFWTASHCIGTQDVANTLQTYWFYDAVTCKGAKVNPEYATLSGGAYVRYANDTRDISLLELKTAPPSGASFAGWTSKAILSLETPVIGIHHPQGDVKKYSLGNVTALSNSFENKSPLYRVEWKAGVTEDGSSGSAMFTVTHNGAYQLRGGLFDGGSSCKTQNEPDYYSRFSDVYPAIRKFLSK